MSQLDPSLTSTPTGAGAGRSTGRLMPDVAQDVTAPIGGRLERVGMSGVEVALSWRDETGRMFLVPARVDAFVSLDDPAAKGIHMSRLFLQLNKLLDESPFGLPLIDQLLHGFVHSHGRLSESSLVRFRFEQMERRTALLSEHSAWRRYPIEVEGLFDGQRTRRRLAVQVAYSSACPCSAALAGQLMQENFLKDHTGHSWVSVAQVGSWLASKGPQSGVPHSQRSHADIVVELADGVSELPISDLIDQVESALATPVQAAVKRADEQEFARLNGANLMFCEDAARRIRAALDVDDRWRDFRVEVAHLESLHPHDAVAIVTKGIAGGLLA